MPSLTPLVLAILAAFPLSGLAQVGLVRPPPPPVATVPKAMPGWRTSGVGPLAPVTVRNAAGGFDQSVNQPRQREIYNWDSFNIGAASSVTFNFPSADSSALNRVSGPAGPSQIFGSLKSQYANPDPAKAPLIGGSVYLINANGILFGRNSTVNVGSLIASTLDLKNSDFLDSLTGSIRDNRSTFNATADLFADERSFVIVDPGAQITTPNGGRVFLFAKNVENAGTIRTPGGQTALAGGSEVFLNDPTTEPIYASEANAAIPALRGLLVEVGGKGSAANLKGGVIDTPRGNSTLVGMAVNQSGRISATTSVSENGSVLLLARGEAAAFSKHAATSGALTLGAGSVIEIAADTALGADGKLPTSDGNTSFTGSRVELSGQTIELRNGASIVAHGGVVNARAESVPSYLTDLSSGFKNDAAARLIIGGGALIDVSGTTTTSVSAARNFVTSELIGKSDLKDAPLQKDGPLYRSKITFDVRNAVPILGDISAYQTGIQRTAEERLARGGSISLTSTGALVTHPGSTLNVSGGHVTYTDAVVNPTRLIASDGARYTLDKAPKDIVYTGIEAASKATTLDRWGIVPQFVPAQAQTGRGELGYVDGQAGGALNLVAPRSILDGDFMATTSAGVRQTGGQSAVAAPAAVTLGFRNTDFAPSREPVFGTAGLLDLAITRFTAALPASFWAAPLAGDVPATSRVAASAINASGVGKLTITADGNIAVLEGADIALAPKSSLDLASTGVGGIALAGDFRSEGGSFTARTRDRQQAPVSGGIVLNAGTAIDVSGAWVNRQLDGATVAAATPGGKVTLSSTRALNLQDASRINVSGAATVSAAGVVQGTDAGSIALESNVLLATGEAASQVHIGADLKGQSLTGGGSLKLLAGSVSIGSQVTPRGVKDGLAPGELLLSTEFFRNGAFTNYDVQAATALTIQPGTLVAPQAGNWLPFAAASQLPSGTRPGDFFDQGQLPDAQRKPASLSLSAVHRGSTKGSGDLSVGAGAQIRVDPLASVALIAGLNLDFEGRIRSPGGGVRLLVASNAAAGTDIGTLRVGTGAVIDVSGQPVLQPRTGPFQQGSVLPGGSVTVENASQFARLTPIVIASGAVINADGASARLGVPVVTANGATTVREQTVASQGGSISIKTLDGGAALAGNLHALGGSADAAAGSFALRLAGTRALPGDPLAQLVDNFTLAIQQAPITSAATLPGSVQVSAQSLSSGFADATLISPERIRFNGDVDLAMARSLKLDAPAIVASPQSTSVAVSGATTLLLGGFQPADIPVANAPIAGKTQLTLQGGLVEFYGQQGLQGFKSVEAKATSEIRFDSSKAQPGKLGLQADLSLRAPQVTATTNADFTVDAPGQKILLAGGDASAAAPLSAGAKLTFNASEITTRDPRDPSQHAVLRLPFGSLALNASERIDISDGSVLSVSGAGTTVPFGVTVGGSNWKYGGVDVAAPVAKTIDLSAPGKAVTVSAGASLDLSGGGDLLALEFVPGSGGSKDVFAGFAGGAFAVIPGITRYAPQDADILAAADANQATARLVLGRQITFGAGAPLPAGTYAVLPARYATLPGAFLVRPTPGSAALALGANVPKADGSSLVGGRFGDAGTPYLDSLSQTFQVQGSVQAQLASEIRQTNANDYFSKQALAAEVAAPRLPADAGRLNIAADQLSLKGKTLFALPTDGQGKVDSRARGGELDLSAPNINISALAAQQPGTLNLSPADLNATGASLIVIGGLRGGATGTDIAVSASTVIVDNAGNPLKASDLLLVANERVELKPGASIESTAANVIAPTLNLSGDGALLRVSGDALAASVRTNTVRAAGDLLIGPGVTLKGGAITAEATRSTTLAADAAIDAKGITLGASRIAAGAVDQAVAGATTLVLAPALAAQIGRADSLTLRSFDRLDLYGAATLGGAAVRSLTIDTGTLRLMSDDARAAITAGEVRLTNSSGAASVAAPGRAELSINAIETVAAVGTTGSAAKPGQVVIGPGSVAVAGAAKVGVDAARELLLTGATDFSTAGDLTVSAAALSAGANASAVVTAGGQFVLNAAGKPAPTGGALGAHVVINAAAITQAGKVLLPSGQLSLNAQGAAGADAVRFAAGSVTDLSGRSSTFDGVTITTAGGDLRASAQAGNVTLDANALLDTSARQTTGRAGSVTIAAPAGAVALNGGMRGVSAPGQAGGSLSVDSAAALDLRALAATLGTEAGNFAEAITLRSRSGDLSLPAGAALAARHIMLSSDSGSLAVAGKLDATASGSTVVLAAGDTLSVLPGAQISSRSTGAVGGEVQLLAGRAQWQADGSFLRNGQVQLDGGNIDTSAAAAGGLDGSVLIRAQHDASDRDVRIGKVAGSVGTSLVGVKRVEFEAVTQYSAEVVDAALIGKINQDNQAFAGAGGANAAAIRSRLANVFVVGAPLQLRAGVEVVSQADLTVTGVAANNGWNLTRFNADGTAAAQASGAPVNVSLRAAGDLKVEASISDGFVPAGAVAPATAAAASKIAPGAVVARIDGAYAEGARVRLVGGADVNAADVMATAPRGDGGDVLIGADNRDVLVRSTTGSIQIAAGRDVVMQNRRAAAYTTGVPVDDLPGYVGNKLTPAAYLNNAGTAQSPFLGGGGKLAVTAGRDLAGATDTPPQYGTEWLWRARDLAVLGGEPVFWSRYDRFKQGFATFGGGGVTAAAGNDALNVEVSTGIGGYVARNADRSSAGARQFGGGDVSLQAHRDVVGGFVLSGSGSARVNSGRDIASPVDAPGLRVLHGNSQIQIGALNSVDVGAVTSFGLAPWTVQFANRTLALYVSGLASNASLDVLASSGNLRYRSNVGAPEGTTERKHFGSGVPIIPDRASFAAPQGDVSLAELVQVPAGNTSLNVLAGQNVTATKITVTGTDGQSAAPTWLTETQATTLVDNAFRAGRAPLDLGVRTPLRVVAAAGDVRVSEAIDTATQLRLLAGRDVALASEAGSSFRGLVSQHQSDDELSLVQAGRDVLLPASGNTFFDLRLHGPGNQLVTAGRNVDLKTSGGAGGVGNRENAALPAHSGKVTVVAGVALGGADYRQAQAWYFPLLGGTGIAGFAADLAAQLTAVRAGQPLPALGSEASARFKAASIDEQIAQAKTLAGDAAFDAALLSGVRLKNVRLDKPEPTPDLPQARLTFGKWNAAEKFTVVSAALANAWAASVPADQQQTQALAMGTHSTEASYITALVGFVGTQTNRADLTPASALMAFTALPVERQLLFTNQVLATEVRNAGRAASLLAGAPRDAAYERAYQALDVVFPELGVAGDVKMGSSQLRTLQGSDINVLVPRGSVDVGALVADLGSIKGPSQLGIVTAAGGNISMVVRDNVNVNQSRVFTVGKGDLLMWASLGNLDAGRGAKTVTGAPPPLYRIDDKGNFVIDTSGSFSGSGIAVLDASSTLDLYAPKGEINAGDAGIKSLGNAFLGAARFVGADNLAVGGVAVGAPPPATTGGDTAGLAAVGQAATSAGTRINPDDSEEEKQRNRRKRLNLILDFLGFGDGASKP